MPTTSCALITTRATLDQRMYAPLVKAVAEGEVRHRNASPYSPPQHPLVPRATRDRQPRPQPRHRRVPHTHRPRRAWTPATDANEAASATTSPPPCAPQEPSTTTTTAGATLHVANEHYSLPKPSPRAPSTEDSSKSRGPEASPQACNDNESSIRKRNVTSPIDTEAENRRDRAREGNSRRWNAPRRLGVRVGSSRMRCCVSVSVVWGGAGPRLGSARLGIGPVGRFPGEGGWRWFRQAACGEVRRLPSP